MLKPSPSRGHKSKSIKVKHVLQICVLLAVCFWLIYQVKHSQEKRREFDAKGENVVDKVQTDNEVRRFGRKDIPKVTEIATAGDKHEEDDDEKEVEEEENKPQEEEVKHEEDELEREDGRIAEIEEERGGGGGGGDDETDEDEQERKEAEHEHGEEDDEGDTDENHVENEEKAFPGKEDHFETDENEEAGTEDHLEHEEIQDVDTEDHNEKDVASDDHEAREEQYKADDASSEVAHHVHNIIPETENVTTSHANDMFGKVDVGHENETKSSDNLDALMKTEVEPRKLSYRISNGTVVEHSEHGNNSTKSDGGERHNSTSDILPKSQPSMTSNSTSLDGEHPALSNGLQTLFTANVSQNATVEGSPGDKVPNLLANVLEDGIKPKLASDENSQSKASGNLNKTENTTVASQIGNNTDAFEGAKDSPVSNESHDEKLVNNGAGVSDESSSSHSGSEDAGAIQHDPIDESDTNIAGEENESRVDLDTLPDIKSEGQNAEEAMAE